MQFMIEFEAFHTVIDPPTVEALRGTAFAFFAQCAQDPRVKASGHFTDGRSGFMVVEVGSLEEIYGFTGRFLDSVRFSVRPSLPLGQFLQHAEQIFGMPQ